MHAAAIFFKQGCRKFAFNRYFSEVDAHTTCNNEFTERHPVAAELKDGPRQQRFRAAECISSRSTCPPFALKTWSNSGCKLPFMGSVGPHRLSGLAVDGKEEIYLEWP